MSAGPWKNPKLPTGDLRPREQECALLLARGYNNIEIGQIMGITRKTAEWYVHVIYDYYDLNPGPRADRVKLANLILRGTEIIDAEPYTDARGQRQALGA